MKRISLKVCLLSLVVAVAAMAAKETAVSSGSGVSGAVEGGLVYGMQKNANKGLGWLLDQASMTHRWDVSDKVKVVVTNAMAFTPKSDANTFNNTVGFLSPLARLSAGEFTLLNQEAYLEHKCSEGIHMSFGHMRKSFGMEGMTDRYNSWTYFYSTAHGMAQAMGWNYDLGFKWTFSDFLPGKLEVGLFRGNSVNNTSFTSTRTTKGDNSVATAIRWAGEFGSGDMSFTPALSLYLDRWAGSPADMGFGVGTGIKAGMIKANIEWLYWSTKIDPNGSAATNKASGWSVYVEPAVDLGMFDASLKWEMASNDVFAGTSTSDMNLGVAITKNYSDKLRARLMWNMFGMSDKFVYGFGGPNVSYNEFRLMVGTSW